MYFNLKDPKADKESLIVLRYFISKTEGRFVFSTGLTISPKDWDKNTKMAKAARGRADLSSINRKLQEHVSFLEKTLSDFDLNNIALTKENLKGRFLANFKDEINNFEIKYFTDFVQNFINEIPGLTNRTTKRSYSPRKIIQYKSTHNRLKDFESFSKNKIRLDHFTLAVYDKLVDFLKTDKGYSLNTVGDIIKNVKVFLNRAEDKGYVLHPDYKKPAFAILREDSVAIALSEAEIEKLFQHDFSKNPRLENCRDLSLIGLWTGLRVSDFLSLPAINAEDKFITVQPKKTKHSSGVKVVIPLHHHIKTMVRERGMPRSISDVKFNKYFKEVCKEVGLTDVVEGTKVVKQENTGRFRKETGIYPKYQVVSSHTCRRSFATNLYKMNFPAISIMKITGHTTEKSFLTYIKVTPTEHAEKLLEHWKAYYGR